MRGALNADQRTRLQWPRHNVVKAHVEKASALFVARQAAAVVEQLVHAVRKRVLANARRRAELGCVALKRAEHAQLVLQRRVRGAALARLAVAHDVARARHRLRQHVELNRVRNAFENPVRRRAGLEVVALVLLAVVVVVARRAALVDARQRLLQPALEIGVLLVCLVDARVEQHAVVGRNALALVARRLGEHEARQRLVHLAPRRVVVEPQVLQQQPVLLGHVDAELVRNVLEAFEQRHVAPNCVASRGARRRVDRQRAFVALHRCST